MAAAGEAAAAPAVLAVATLCCDGWQFYGTERALVPVPAGAPLTLSPGAMTPLGAFEPSWISVFYDDAVIGTLAGLCPLLFGVPNGLCVKPEATCGGLNSDGRGHAVTLRVLARPGASVPHQLHIRLVCLAAHNPPTPGALPMRTTASPDGGVHLAAGADGVAWARANPPSALFAANPDAGAAPVRYLHASAPGAAALPLRGGHWCATARGRTAAAAHSSRARPCLLQVVCLFAAGRAGPGVDGRGCGAGSGRLGHCRPHRAVR
jgi:hypothetical protein